jgi:hypothetical protein
MAAWRINEKTIGSAPTIGGNQFLGFYEGRGDNDVLRGRPPHRKSSDPLANGRLRIHLA